MNNPYLIAEIAQAHDGSLGIAHSYIDALAKTGVNAIKFQFHYADAESSIHEPFRINFSYQDSSRFDYWKRMEFSQDQWKSLKDHCEKVGLDFIVSPFSNYSVDILEKIGVSSYKIGSGEVNNFLLLEKLASTGKPLIISSGLSSYNELDKTISFLEKRKANYSLLQCTTSYPTTPEQWGLNVIKELNTKYNCKIGFSDHSGDILACIAAILNGAEILEFHAVFDKAMFGPDSSSSLTISQISDLVKKVKDLKISLVNDVDKNDLSAFKNLKSIFEKSLAINRNLKKGTEITFDMLEAKKPKGFGIDSSLFESVIGKKINKDLNKWDFITNKDLYE